MVERFPVSLESYSFTHLADQCGSTEWPSTSSRATLGHSSLVSRSSPWLPSNSLDQASHNLPWIDAKEMTQKKRRSRYPGRRREPPASPYHPRTRAFTTSSCFWYRTLQSVGLRVSVAVYDACCHRYVLLVQPQVYTIRTTTGPRYILFVQHRYFVTSWYYSYPI